MRVRTEVLLGLIERALLDRFPYLLDDGLNGGQTRGTNVNDRPFENDSSLLIHRKAELNTRPEGPSRILRRNACTLLARKAFVKVFVEVSQ